MKFAVCSGTFRLDNAVVAALDLACARRACVGFAVEAGVHRSATEVSTRRTGNRGQRGPDRRPRSAHAGSAREGIFKVLETVRDEAVFIRQNTCSPADNLVKPTMLVSLRRKPARRISCLFA